MPCNYGILLNLIRIITMALRKVKTSVREISRTGRIKLFKNSWFTVATGLQPVSPGKVYNFVIDDIKMLISDVRDPMDTELTRDYISGLQDSEIDRLNALCALNTEFITSLPAHLQASYSRLIAQNEIDLHSSINEIEYHQTAEHASRDTGYSVKHLTQATSGKAQGFMTYRDDIAVERLRTGNMNAIQAHEHKYGL